MAIRSFFGGGDDTGNGPSPFPADYRNRQLLPKDIAVFAEEVAKEDVEKRILDAVNSNALYSLNPARGLTSSAIGGFSSFMTTAMPTSFISR